MTTLEQVFLNICEEFTDLDDEDGLSLGASSFRDDNPLSQEALPPQTRRKAQQLRIMIYKREWNPSIPNALWWCMIS